MSSAHVTTTFALDPRKTWLKKHHKLTSPMVLVVDAILTALVFLEWPFVGLLTSPSAIRFRELISFPSVTILSWTDARADSCRSWLSWLGPA